jgi:hypothetical protein
MIAAEDKCPPEWPFFNESDDEEDNEPPDEVSDLVEADIDLIPIELMFVELPSESTLFVMPRPFMSVFNVRLNVRIKVRGVKKQSRSSSPLLLYVIFVEIWLKLAHLLLNLLTQEKNSVI